MTLTESRAWLRCIGEKLSDPSFTLALRNAFTALESLGAVYLWRHITLLASWPHSPPSHVTERFFWRHCTIPQILLTPYDVISDIIIVQPLMKHFFLCIRGNFCIFYLYEISCRNKFNWIDTDGIFILASEKSFWCILWYDTSFCTISPLLRSAFDGKFPVKALRNLKAVTLARRHSVTSYTKLIIALLIFLAISQFLLKIYLP